MLTAHGMLHALSAREVRELALVAFELGFHYSPEAAVEATDACMAAATPGHHDAMNAILHRGIDGHRQYLVGEGLAENIRSVLAHYEKK
jgi:DNA-binding CsgD family transcriptional regulator